ncbi:MAG TPA: peroxidase-related enzyme [Terriglobia bacterium]|nr:peroxidase-related enzyme [Terriglobia bacterium]
MSFVQQVEESEAGDRLAPVYQKIRDSFGFVPNYFKALGARPELILTHLDLSERVTADGALPRGVKERLGIVVSGINASSYCVAVHMEILHKLGVERSLGRTLAVNYPQAAVEEREQALYRFADQLTTRPGDVGQVDVDAVKQAGWDDAAVVEAVLAVAYFNFINRVSLGLGLMADF